MAPWYIRYIPAFIVVRLVLLFAVLLIANLVPQARADAIGGN